MRGLLVVIAVAVVAIWWGGHHLRVALTNRHPIEISCAEYAAAPPDAEWLRLTHCEIGENIAYETDTTAAHRVNKVYLPLYPQGAATVGAPAKIVVLRDDYAVTKLGGEPSQPELETLSEVTYEGVIQRGYALSDRDQHELAAMHLGLAADFAILERGAEPEPEPLIYGAAALVFGLGALGWLGVTARRAWWPRAAADADDGTAAEPVAERRERPMRRGAPVSLPNLSGDPFRGAPAVDLESRLVRPPTAAPNAPRAEVANAEPPKLLR